MSSDRSQPDSRPAHAQTPQSKAPGQPPGGGGPNRAPPNADEQSLIETIPWKQAIIFGIGAFVLGFALQFVLLEVDAAMSDTTETTDETSDIEGEPNDMTIRGWWYFSAQFVDIKGETVVGSVSFDYFDEIYDGTPSEPKLPALAYRLAPVVALLTAGFALTRRVLRRQTRSERSPAAIGATIMAGYLLTVIVATFLFSWSTTADGTSVTYSIPLGDAVLFAGLIYPGVFGAIGGYLAGR